MIEKKRFFVFETIVRSNRHGNDFVNNVLNKKEVLRFCSKREGSAVRFDIIDNVDAADASPYTIDIFYHEFFETLGQIQFWTTKSMKRLSNIKSEMFKNGIERASATCALYLEELVGDCAQCGMLVSFYQHRLSQQTEKEMQLQQSQKSISTKRLQNLLMVDANDENFIAFRNIIDDMVKSAICQLYGRFSEYTQPIITQSMLRHMENAFRSLFPVQYHACRAMIGKQSVINIDSEETMNNDSSPLNIRLNQTWDRYILYLFIQQCRVRNSHYFSWFAVVNAAASYGANRLHIPVHFGFSVSFTSLCRKLNSLFTFQQVMQRTTESLNEYSNFAIAVFDNSQLNLPLKFQRYASCGNMSLATTRLFIRPTIPDYLNDIVEDINCITIEYLDQAIPSPYGMPKFENINHLDSFFIL